MISAIAVVILICSAYFSSTVARGPNPYSLRIFEPKNLIPPGKAVESVNEYLELYNLKMRPEVGNYSIRSAYFVDYEGTLIYDLIFSSHKIASPYDADFHIALEVYPERINNATGYIDALGWNHNYTLETGGYVVQTYIHGQPAELAENVYSGIPENHFNTERINIVTIYIGRSEAVQMFLVSVKFDVYTLKGIADQILIELD